MTLLLLWSLKATLLLGLALVGVALLRGRSAAMRHWLLAAAILCALALPAFSLISPDWQLAVPALAAIDDAARPPAPAASVQPAPRIPAPANRAPAHPAPGEPTRSPSFAGVLLTLWLAGLLFALAFVAVGLRRLSVLRRGARPDSDGEWQAMADAQCAALGIRRRVDVLFSPDRPLPITWGARRPRILLPDAAAQWPAERRRIVLFHELAHIERGDWAFHMAGELLRGVFWFNPLAWFASVRLRQESEAACDDRVLAWGVSGVDYASQLLELARAFGQPRDEYLPAPAMLRPSSLERRVQAMLNPALDRAAISRKGRGSVIAAAAVIAVALAGVTAAQTFATFAGSVVDPTNAVLPQVTFVLTNTTTGAKHEVKTGRDGRVELPGLVPGDYNVEASLPGFMTFKSHVTLADGQRFEPAVMLQVGELEETVTVVDDGQPDTRLRLATPSPRPVTRCNANAAAASATRIGGNIKAPRRLNNVPPAYPANLLGSGRSASVLLKGRIGVDGRMQDVSVVGDADPDFAASAITAVSQWEYTETLLNCQPWPVAITVHLQYRGA